MLRCTRYQPRPPQRDDADAISLGEIDEDPPHPAPRQDPVRRPSGGPRPRADGTRSPQCRGHGRLHPESDRNSGRDHHLGRDARPADGGDRGDGRCLRRSVDRGAADLRRRPGLPCSPWCGASRTRSKLRSSSATTRVSKSWPRRWLASRDEGVRLPTSGLALLEFDVERWDAVRAGAGRLREVATPRTIT